MRMRAKTAHVAEWKKEEVKRLEELMKKYPVIGVANIQNFPAKQFQEVRKALRDKAVVRVAKLNLFKIALEKVPELKVISDYVNGPTAFIFTDMDPFKLFKVLSENSSKTYAKPGQIAPEDIVVPAGDTGLPPGPALGDLRSAGIEAKIEGPTIKVVKDSVVVRKGEVITPEVANALTKLDIKPFEVKLSLEAVYQNGIVFTADVLGIKTEDTIASMQTAYNNAFNLSFNIGYFTKDNVEIFIVNAFRNAKALGLEAMILDKGVIDDILARASAQAKTLSTYVKEPQPEASGDTDSESKEEQKSETKPDDEKNQEEKDEPEEKK